MGATIAIPPFPTKHTDSYRLNVCKIGALTI